MSAIPEHAREEDITGKPGSVRGKVVKNYYLGREYVGHRVYTRDGRLERECSYKNGQLHGCEYRWHRNGELLAALPFHHGRQHGTVRVWGSSGALLGLYTMDHGTGIDLWWIELEGTAQLTEARVVVDNLMDGYEYWFTWGQPGMLRKEKWWSKGWLHGIEREWNERGRLRRGFPKYWLQGRQVDKRTYQRAVKADPTLKPFNIEENLPDRAFPPEIAVWIP